MPVNLPRFSPEEPLGLTFLYDTGDGERVRAKIVKKIQDKDAENHEQIKQSLCMFSYDRLQSLFAKLVQTAVMHQYRIVHPKDSLYEEDLPTPDALEPPLLQLSTRNFQGICPI